MASPSVPEQSPDPPHPIYLDNLATTPVDPRVLDAVLPFFGNKFGNASSSTHGFGWAAADAVHTARSQVAALIGARPQEIVFTSGATEANNLALKGIVMRSGGGCHIVASAIEHASVLDCCESLRRSAGVEVTIVPVDGTGLVDPTDLDRAINDRTILVSVMAANNEVGTIQNLREIGEVVGRHGVPWLCDAAQAAGKIPLDVSAVEVDLMSLSAHKMYAPKGQGALFVRANRRPRLRLSPQLEGGGQENGLRAGTLNVPGVVGLGTASEICAREMTIESQRLAVLRDRLLHGLERTVRPMDVNGHPSHGLRGCLSVTLPGAPGADLMLALKDQIAVSSGSACKSHTGEPSHVLKAIGLDDTAASSTLRFGIGRFTTAEEVDAAAIKVGAEVRRLREQGAFQAGDGVA